MAKKPVALKTPSGNVLALANELLEVARSDLASARTLHAQRLFPQAVFALQQAVEKTGKACGLSIGVAVPNDLRNEWSHNPLKLSELFADYREQQLNPTAPSGPPVGMSAAGIKAFIDKLRAPSAMTEPFLLFMIDWSQSISAEYRAFRADPQKVRSEHDKMITWAIGDATEPNQIAKASAYAVYLSTAIAESVVIQLGLMALGMATIPHAVQARYPMGGVTPTQLYTASYPVVHHLPALCDLNDDVLANVQSFIDNASTRDAIEAMPD